MGGGTCTRERCVVVNKAERSWIFEELFDIRHGGAELDFYIASFWFYFFSVSPHCAPSVCFGMIMDILYILFWKCVIQILLLVLQGIIVKKLHESQKRL